MNELGSKDWRRDTSAGVESTIAAEVADAEPKKRRHLPRAARRLQLIDATVDSIAKRGFAETTLSHVAKTAGLSQGIINLHFESKDTLLVETLKHLRDEFRSAWQKKLASAGENPALQVWALIDVFFNRKTSSKKKIAGWFAFIGEAKSRPVYRNICEAHDKEYFEALVKSCGLLIDEGGYTGFTASDVASGLEAMIEGLWLAVYLSPDGMDRERAKQVSTVFLTQFFPGHFPIEGA